MLQFATWLGNRRSHCTLQHKLFIYTPQPTNVAPPPQQWMIHKQLAKWPANIFHSFQVVNRKTHPRIITLCTWPVTLWLFWPWGTFCPGLALASWQVCPEGSPGSACSARCCCHHGPHCPHWHCSCCCHCCCSPWHEQDDAAGSRYLPPRQHQRSRDWWEIIQDLDFKSI